MKVVKDGKVAVLVSPGFGAGWYTWNTGNKDCLFDADVVAAVLSGDNLKAADLAKEKWGEKFYTGGAETLEVFWVTEGTEFQVEEYDGSESLNFKEYQAWITA
jgi:hypothetical protein